MRKTYQIPSIEVLKVSSVLPLAASISPGEETDHFDSRGYKGGVVDDDDAPESKDFGW